MDNRQHESIDSTTGPTVRNPESHLQGSGMFTGSENFTVTGGAFTNITNHHAATVPSDFRMIPLGDIDLRREIQVHSSSTGVVDRQREPECARRVYSAKVEDRRPKFTAAVYQGNGAEEEWRQNIAKYMSIRHPNIVQIYGAASSGGIYATLYHGDLVPFRQYINAYRDSHFVTVYLYASCTVDYYAAISHVSSTTEYFEGYTVWIRRSTGRLCAELISPSDPTFAFHSRHIISNFQGTTASVPSDAEGIVVESLTTEQYHRICSRDLSQYRNICNSTSMTVKLGAIISWSPGYPREEPVEIAYAPNANPRVHGWATFEGAKGAVMEDGWTRFKSVDVFNRIIALTVIHPYTYRHLWLSQANHIFRRLRITFNLEHHVLVHRAVFHIEVFAATEDPPAGFLFLCPLEDFRSRSSSFSWPDCPAYWCLDPSGVDRLSAEEATQLGFPAFQRSTEIGGYSWDSSVYEGLRKFQQGKGFDPDTQDLARHLGYPLYQLSSQGDLPFAHVNEGDFEQEGWNTEDGHRSDNAQAETSTNEDLGSYSERDGGRDPEPVRTDCSSDSHSAQNSNSGNQASSHTGNVAGNTSDPPTLHSEMLSLSGTFKLIMNVQLMLMLFLALAWAYEHV